MRKQQIFLLLLFFPTISLQAQNKFPFALKETIIRIDTATYTWSANAVSYQDAKFLSFRYEKNNPICEVELYPLHIQQINHIKLLPSADYEVLDSVNKVGQEYFRFKVRFQNLDESNFLVFNFIIDNEGDRGRENVQQIKLFPYTQVRAKLFLKDNELYIGEERVFEIDVDKFQLIRATNQWTENEAINYKISEKNGKVYLHIFPTQENAQMLNLQLFTTKPFIANGKITSMLPLMQVNFNVRQSRLAFLEADKKDVTLHDDFTVGTEILIEHHHKLQMQKTYRIENQEESGGYLVGEIFTKSKLSNNKVLAILRLYALHRTTDGYLYLKDGDKSQFITNFEITPKMQIAKVSLQKEGGDWSGDLSVHAGESIEVKIEGTALNKANFRFEGLAEIKTDSVVKTENMQLFKLKIPANISKRKIFIYDNNQPTAYALNIKEQQKPHALDFVDIDFGAGDVKITDLNQPILYYETVRSIILSFRPDKIDAENKFFGRQILSIDIKITGANRQLIEVATIPRIVICPDENATRFAFYDKKDCSTNDINLNNFISRKTHELEDWSRIELTIRHKADEHGGNAGFTQKIEIILAKYTNFDIDVSFPAGLLTKKIGDSDFSSLGGISIAAIAQFKFFRPNKIAQLRPYRIGIGALALDAFNLRDTNTNRDLGIVVIGSLYPSRRDAKLSFPLFLGFGYLVKQERWFYLLGPGIRVNL
ncbi:MAG: hypothetical protein EAZ08_05650 [Cytophagales bacterium]|nr:MAG: hypothetical protein EAZ08_05650 [Cytophagales bacterium]